MSWDEGYVSEIDYIRLYTRELNPLMLNLALLAYGYQPLERRRLHYLELGCGQGLSLNAHAAANEGVFWGDDFNPSHVLTAKLMAESSDASVFIVDDSFEQFINRKDLPEFDMIVLHGVWSWVSEENRQILVDIVRSKLALGGILYLSYNTTPGWSMIAPLQHLMMLHSRYMTSPSNSLPSKVESAFDFIEQFINSGASFFKNTPLVVDHFKRMQKNDRIYLAHEYYNDNWSPIPFAQTARLLADTKLTFVGDAGIGNVFADALLPVNIKNILAEIKDPLFYQSVRDFCNHQIFRKDIWVKGGMPLSSLQRLQRLAEIRFTLLFNPLNEPLAISCNVGTLPLDEALARPIINLLAQDNYAPKSINDLLQHPELRHINLAQVCDMMLRLCGRYVSPTHDEETIVKLKPQTDKLNAYLMNQDPASKHSEFLVSPVIGGGVSVPYTHQLFLLAVKNECGAPADAVKFVWQTMSAKGHRMKNRDGYLLDDEYANVQELSVHAKPFFETHLPVFRALKII